ncbi:MAG: CRISPR system precrRNA processing endoribonuclease RAMP protein Cas6, partial [Syntrophales bacterium]|nr:CRISPR system precrRNA processing endoribonuclease RAMP protein Cas6 [Syntrophales bacterium]
MMLYGRYHFSGIFEDDAILPEYKGSTFRGVFGHALKKVVCALRRQDCLDCLLRQKCLYVFVFETARENGETAGRKRIAAPPHPYVIVSPESTQTHYCKGEPFRFSLLLFGRANEYLPYFIYSMDQMGKMGIGKQINGKRASFELTEVAVDNTVIYRKEDGKIRKGSFVRDLKLSTEPLGNSRPFETVEVTLLTPLRLKYENHLNAALPFHVLTRAMLRRISSLCQYHGDGEPNLDYRGLVARAKDVDVVDSSIRWVDWRRYSNRQEQAMLMGGMTGKVTYRGELDEFVPLLMFCEKVHIGKQTAFGLGRFRLTSSPLAGE